MNDSAVKTQIEILKGKMPTWNRERFLLVAADRGYLTERSVIYDISQTLDVSMAEARRMLRKGRWKMEHVLIIAAKFEMTPKEFCDCFLYGLFFEDDQGQFRAHLDKLVERAMLNPLPRKVISESRWNRMLDE